MQEILKKEQQAGRTKASGSPEQKIADSKPTHKVHIRHLGLLCSRTLPPNPRIRKVLFAFSVHHLGSYKSALSVEADYSFRTESPQVVPLGKASASEIPQLPHPERFLNPHNCR